MRKRLIALVLCLGLTLSMAGSVLGAGGDENDPVVSQSYLENVFKSQMLQYVQESMVGVMANARASAVQKLADRVAAVWQEKEQGRVGARQMLGTVVLKEGDKVTFKQGCRFTVLSGAVAAEDTLADITQGIAVDPAVTPVLDARRTYMQKTTAGKELAVTSATAELWIDGNFVLRASNSVDYGSMADGLKAMGLFRGTNTGYDLESGTTRVQGLVMFLRLMGLEDEALACTADVPFTDVPANHWARGYVAYAYQHGLSNGTSATAFSPNAPVTAQHYLTFLMRALRYDEGTQFTYNTVLADAVKQGLFNETEIAAMSRGELLRCRIVYLSYYALYCVDKLENIMLVDKLIADGAITEEAFFQGMAAVKSPRLRAETET